MRKLFIKTWIVPILVVFFLFQIICLPSTASAKYKDNSDDLWEDNFDDGVGVILVVAVVVAVIGVIWHIKNKKNKTVKNEISNSANAKLLKNRRMNDLKSNNSQISPVDTKEKNSTRIFDAKRINISDKGLAFNF